MIKEIFGNGNDLTTLQMTARGVVVFLISIVLIRISGRRSFGMRTPFDNVIAILLGAILSRAITGASPFFPVIGASTAIAVLHRIFALIGLYNSDFGSLVKGKPEIVYENGKFNRTAMRKCLVSENDLRQAVRTRNQSRSFEQIEKIFVERNGDISILKKKETANITSR